MNHKLYLRGIKREYGHWLYYRTIDLVDIINTELDTLHVTYNELYTFYKDKLVKFILTSIIKRKTPMYYQEKLNIALIRIYRTLNRGNQYKKHIKKVFTKIYDAIEKF